MRPVFWYILIVVAVAFIVMFFVCQNSKHVRIGYQLTRLRRDRDALQERGRQLESAVWAAAKQEELVKTAARLGLDLISPVSDDSPE